MDEIVEKLKQIGLNEYQSKVYLALLKKYPATGYEISKLANIPQSRTYDTLKSLETMQIALSSNTKPVTYTPIKPKELTKRYKRKIESTIDFLDKKLPNIKEETYTEPVLTIFGRTKILDKAKELIQTANKSIYISLFSPDFKHLEQYLLDAYMRGLDVKIVKYDEFICNFGTVFEHFGIQMFEHYHNDKFIFLSVDNSEGIFGISEPSKHNNSAEILWTKNPEIVFLIKAFCAHDMYLIDIASNFPEQLRYFYGAGLKKLRDKILH